MKQYDVIEGILHLTGNQKRACLTLGALLHQRAKVDSQRSEELLQHVHTWLETDGHLGQLKTLLMYLK